MLAPQGALEQRSPLNVCLGDVHSLLLALQELYARMKAQVFWGMIMVIRGKLCKGWGLVLTAGRGRSIRTTVFPGKFCWAYSTRSLKTHSSVSVSANVKEGSLNPNLTKVTITFLT